ncbi:hypothetical protein AB4Y42_34635 [Paraburkholderia sp. EG286B]|uniref:hypothetical protein n=1 Tax=Paraburkholderia sp. EG286B TaxID=3237011 RepID=UPI0034D31043
MNEELIELARTAGMFVQLDAVIGNQLYSSVSGSLEALRRFGEAYVELQRRTTGALDQQKKI